MITGTITQQGIYKDEKDICELYICKNSSDRLPHEYRKKKSIYIDIGSTEYEAGVHETKKGVVWVSSVLYTRGARREKVRLVDVLDKIELKKGDQIRIQSNNDGTFSIVPQKFSGK